MTCYNRMLFSFILNENESHFTFFLNANIHGNRGSGMGSGRSGFTPSVEKASSDGRIELVDEKCNALSRI